jgi:hypothetical protein
MKTLSMILAVGLILFCASVPYAANDNQFGTAGAQELRIPMGARNIAMAGAGIAGVTGVDAVYWNPAGLSSLQSTQASLSRLNYLLDVDVNTGAVATQLGSMGVMAFSIKVLSVGDIPVTTEQNPEGTGEFFAPSMAVVGLTYARQLTDRVSFGATGMFINEDIHRVRASGVAFDFGFLYDPQWQGLDPDSTRTFPSRVWTRGSQTRRCEPSQQRSNCRRTCNSAFRTISSPNIRTMPFSMDRIRATTIQMTSTVWAENTAGGSPYFCARGMSPPVWTSTSMT